MLNDVYLNLNVKQSHQAAVWVRDLNFGFGMKEEHRNVHRDVGDTEAVGKTESRTMVIDKLTRKRIINHWIPVQYVYNTTTYAYILMSIDEFYTVRMRIFLESDLRLCRTD